MRFHVAGLGSIGTLLAFHLRRAVDPKHSITLIHKNNELADNARGLGGHLSVEYNGAFLTETGFRHEGFHPIGRIYREAVREARQFRAGNTGVPVDSQPSGDSPATSSDTSIDSLFITTKAHAVQHVVEGLLPRLSPHCTIVLMVNGMGVYESITNKFFRNPDTRPHFILASNTHGAWLKRPYRAVHAGTGAIQFGIVPDPRGRDFEASMHSGGILSPPYRRRVNLNDIALPKDDPNSTEYVSLRNTVTALLSMQDLHTEWLPMSELQLAMRRKLVANAVINPLTALLNCRNGEIFKTEEGVRIMRRVCQEAEEVFAADIRSQPRGFEYPVDEAPQGDPVPPSLKAEGLEQNCLNIATGTAMNFSSMLNDIRYGKKTEIDFLNGYLLMLGEKYGIQMGATATLLNLIKMRCAIPPNPL
ncbi:ketopantoate reductase-like protein [Gloeophyllum trabeum ATCC 11539]|uniref:2-dehydropantoate 2-reductase n=1 Tax=Gloeophyllum trabeum (strain ATCC 11539 / FP-39264 / Madison 617) TaxID=670483 RepID=S7QKT6_GLOTA|nr:ketopantoate reductase-like protein [Gloeophyllum trabeum ATCC 11539]EPQ60431.1 ketopantoate reductase-like protein [Gloeophyllum trabeum ATCC 11539]